jgi:hypothetical protein
MGRKNRILCQGTLGIMEKVLELQVVYCHLSEAEHKLNFSRSKLEHAREEVDTRIHAIVHLENAVKTQDLKLEERVEQIATLEH